MTMTIVHRHHQWVSEFVTQYWFSMYYGPEEYLEPNCHFAYWPPSNCPFDEHEYDHCIGRVIDSGPGVPEGTVEHGASAPKSQQVVETLELRFSGLWQQIGSHKSRKEEMGAPLVIVEKRCLYLMLGYLRV